MKVRAMSSGEVGFYEHGNGLARLKHPKNRRLLLKISFWVCLGLFEFKICEPKLAYASAPELAKPTQTVDLTRFGYRELKANLVDSTLGDIISHLVMVSDQLVVVYHTMPDGMRVAASNGTLTAYFVNVSDGKLVRKQDWRTIRRRDSGEGKDSEARIYALSQDRYIVIASGTLLLYNRDGSLTIQKKLDPGLWSIQPVQMGTVLLLRHERKDQKQSFVKYIWADSQSLATLAEVEDGQELRSQIGLLGADQWLVYRDSNGIQKMTVDGLDGVMCSDDFCRESGPSNAVRGGVIVSSRFGLEMLSFDKGLVWQKSIQPAGGLDRITIGGVQTSLNGEYLAVLVLRGNKYRTFDDVHLDKNEEVFVYSATDGKCLFLLPGAIQALALSPNGTQVVSFDGKYLRVCGKP